MKYAFLKIADICLIIEKFEVFQNLRSLAITWISTIIEIYVDMIRVSHGFKGCQMLEYIADTCNSTPRAGLGNITGFFGPSFLPIRWSYLH